MIRMQGDIYIIMFSHNMSIYGQCNGAFAHRSYSDSRRKLTSTRGYLNDAIGICFF